MRRFIALPARRQAGSTVATFSAKADNASFVSSPTKVKGVNLGAVGVPYGFRPPACHFANS